jgi:hypothetical protein
MSQYLHRAQNYHAAIRNILLKEWDPIGVAHVPEAEDEYDGYVGAIYRMLIAHVPRLALVDHLWQLETGHMALSGSRTHTEAIADRLLRLRDEVERSG